MKSPLQLSRILVLAIAYLGLSTACSDVVTTTPVDTSTDTGSETTTNDATVDASPGDVGTDSGTQDAGSETTTEDVATDTGNNTGSDTGGEDTSEPEPETNPFAGSFDAVYDRTEVFGLELPHIGTENATIRDLAVMDGELYTIASASSPDPEVGSVWGLAKLAPVGESNLTFQEMWVAPRGMLFLSAVGNSFAAITICPPADPDAFTILEFCLSHFTMDGNDISPPVLVEKIGFMTGIGTTTYVAGAEGQNCTDGEGCESYCLSVLGKNMESGAQLTFPGTDTDCWDHSIFRMIASADNTLIIGSLSCKIDDVAGPYEDCHDNQEGLKQLILTSYDSVSGVYGDWDMILLPNWVEDPKGMAYFNGQLVLIDPAAGSVHFFNVHGSE